MLSKIIRKITNSNKDCQVRMEDSIAIKKLNGIIVPEGTATNQAQAVTFTTEMMALGYMCTPALIDALARISPEDAKLLYGSVINVLRHLRGADAIYKPMYPNFPRQVIEASLLELYLNAITHYHSYGMWRPDYRTRPRGAAFEHATYITLDLVDASKLDSLLGEMLGCNESLSAEDREMVEWLLENRPHADLPEAIPFKETMCLVAAHRLGKGTSIDGFVKTATDALRVITYLSDGDVSLAENTKYISLPRVQRKIFCKLLEGVATEEDVKRHAKKWVRLFHQLHVGDHSKRLYALAKKVRNHDPLASFNGKVEAAITKADTSALIKLLSQRPSEFARRIDHLVRGQRHGEAFVHAFNQVIDAVPTRILLQLMGHLSTRTDDNYQRIVFPKGNTQRATVLREPLPRLDPQLWTPLTNGVYNALSDRFAAMPNLGKVWIDPELMTCPIPTAQRSASAGTRAVARGTHLPLPACGTLRLFIYWIGEDIDLSATMHDENLGYMGHVSYTMLKSDLFRSYHSGDIVQAPAPEGASEFVDVDINAALNAGVRYLAMNVMVYSGPTFAKHQACYAGWMERSAPNSNEIYDPRTVRQKIDLTTASRNAIPVVFDLAKKQAIWCDLATRGNAFSGGNNVESNRANITETLQAVVRNCNKVSLYELFTIHAQARGQLVGRRDDANTIFAWDGDVTPFDVTRITHEFMA